jgi:PAS domain S-box-containing protein
MEPSKDFESVEFARARVADLLARLAKLGQHPDSTALAGALGDFHGRVEALQARFGLLRDILDRTSDLVFAKHADGRYALLNPRGAEVLGKRVEDVLGRDDRVLFAPQDAQRIMAVDARVMQSREPEVHEEECTTSRGRVHLMVTTSVWHGEAREVRGVIGIAQDVGERRRSESVAAQRVESLREFATEATLREERLRRSLAAELQSGLGQDLALAKLYLSRLRERAGAELHEPLRGIEGLVDQADRSLRSITFQITPPSLHDLGLMAALEWMVEDMQRKYGLSVALEDVGAPAVDDERVATIVYRAVRELLVNVATHSGVREAKVRVDRIDDSLRVAVTDAGRGFDALDADLRGYGLFGIDEQLRALQGSMFVESSPTGGTRITLTAPIAAEPTTIV